MIILVFIVILISFVFFINNFKIKEILGNIDGKSEPKYHIVVDIDSNTLYLYDVANNEIVKEYTVATGRWNTPTPTGTYKITQKASWGGGFGTRWMRLSVPWGQYGIHGTNKPYSIGYPASHGCVRMKNKDIDELYGLVKYGTKVTLIKGSFGPFGSGFRVLKPGNKGEDVMAVQKRLKELGYYNGSIDGVYGDSMKYSVHKFQRDNNLGINDWIYNYMYEKLGFYLFE